MTRNRVSSRMVTMTPLRSVGRTDSMMLSVSWLEGVLDYFNVSFTRGSKDRGMIGYTVGQQIVGLYLTEMLLKYAMNRAGQPYGRIHNLSELFSELPKSSRSAVESKYSQLLADEVAETWDFASSVDSFLKFLGDDPLTDSRYFWERSRPYGGSILFTVKDLRQLIYALFIALDDYPEGFPLEQRYETKFISFEESLKEREQRNRPESVEPKRRRDGKRIWVSVLWLEGLLEYFNVRCPHDTDDPRYVGFQLGQRVVGLYLAEMLLKYAVDDLRRPFAYKHDLLSLFNKLPRPRRRAVEKTYQLILSNRVLWTWEYARSVESLLQYSGNNPITETRYFWEFSKPIIPLSPSTFMPLIYALLIELHDYPSGTSLLKKHKTEFVSLEETLIGEPQLPDTLGTSVVPDPG